MFIATTVLAVAIAFVSTHIRIVIGGLIAMMWVLEFAGGQIGDFVDAWPELLGPKIKKSYPQVGKNLGERSEKTSVSNAVPNDTAN
jgi:hypothetical protein